MLAGGIALAGIGGAGLLMEVRALWIAGAAATGAGALGRWEQVYEYMSARAAAYQTQITGRIGEAYVVNGVKFDGFMNGILLDAKGPGYATFVRNGSFMAFFGGANALVDQAVRQLAAAGGTPIQWHFAEAAAAIATRALLFARGITGIEIIHTP